MAKTADYGLGPHTFPRGWMMVATSEDVRDIPVALRTLGRDLVAYLGESGQAFVMDAYCPHMRAHLAAPQTSSAAEKRVEGDSIRCPYHSWRFGPDGRCNEIPYLDGKIPSAAKIRAYPTEERYGCIFIWHDEEQQAPTHPLPDLSEWEDENWTSGVWKNLGTITVHPQEVVDNLVDSRHFGPIHGQILHYFESVFDGVCAQQLSGGGHETMASDGASLIVDAYYTGPSLLVGKYTGETDAMQLIFHTPKEDGSTEIWHNILTQNIDGYDEAANRELNRSYYDNGLAAFSQDFSIWETKEAAIQILMVGQDGPFHRLRQWYRQFYNPVADAPKWQERANGHHATSGMPGYSG